ncbi:MAG TPA: hypothetical protein QF624_06190 [Dehalococcoidia bacterium]|nr:hypothetical protein [Dehalococcoidia bacterium]
MAGDADRTEDDRASASAPGPRDLVQGALVNDDDPRFPWWVPLPGLTLALTWAAYEGVMDGDASVFFSTLLWPGAALVVLIGIATFLGWQLDID